MGQFGLHWENVPRKMASQPIEIGSMLLQMCVPTSNYSHGIERNKIKLIDNEIMYMTRLLIPCFSSNS
jgi:hypothetical protein